MGGAHARNILELRSWKAQRALEICQARPCPLTTCHLRWHGLLPILTGARSVKSRDQARAPAKPAIQQRSCMHETAIDLQCKLQTAHHAQQSIAGILVLSHVWMQTRQQSICVRHEDVVDNTTTWLMDFQEQFGLATKPGFPIEVRSPTCPKHADNPDSLSSNVAHLPEGRRQLKISTSKVNLHAEGLCMTRRDTSALQRPWSHTSHSEISVRRRR